MKDRFKTVGILPIVTWMIIFALIPLIYIFVLSFLTRGASGNIVIKFTFENYKRIFDPVYMKIFKISLITAFSTSFIALFIGYPFAYFTANLKHKNKIIIILLILIPFWISSLLRTYGWIILLRNDGIINSLLIHLGIIEKPLKLMYNYKTVIAGMVYMLLPFMILPIYNSVDKLDKSFIEASRDLGAGKIKTFIYITLPLTLQGIIGGFTLVFIPAIGLFFISDLLGGAKTMLLGNLIQNQMSTSRNWPFGAAISMVMLVGVIFFVILYKVVELRHTSRGD